VTRSGWILTTCVAALGATASALFPPLPRLIWNASASVPIGLYAMHPVGKLQLSELVVVRAPPALAQFLAERHYLPIGVPMLKRVLALSGQTVCRWGRTVIVDGVSMGDALDRDSEGRKLPVWQGCRQIGHGEIFLMNRQSQDSFDVRYFGPLPVTSIAGEATPLWLREVH
jgi:conjugative transfer signal peptidase TraF